MICRESPQAVRNQLLSPNHPLLQQSEDHHPGGSADEYFSVGDHGRDVFVVRKIIATTGLVTIVQLSAQIVRVIGVQDASVAAPRFDSPNDSVGGAVCRYAWRGPRILLGLCPAMETRNNTRLTIANS